MNINKDICQLKGEELDQWLKEGRKSTVRRLEEYYQEEMRIDKIIKEIQRKPIKRYILIKDQKSRITIEGEIKEHILKILLREGYKHIY